MIHHTSYINYLPSYYPALKNLSEKFLYSKIHWKSQFPLAHCEASWGSMRHYSRVCIKCYGLKDKHEILRKHLSISQSHYRVVKWNFIFLNFALLRQVMNTKYEADVILYFHNKFQPDPCPCVRARGKNLKFTILNYWVHLKSKYPVWLLRFKR